MASFPNSMDALKEPNVLRFGVEGEAMHARQAHQIIGDPETVQRGLTDLLERTAADELVLTAIVHDHADRIRSHELVAALKVPPAWPQVVR